jgi:hypothetical protein
MVGVGLGAGLKPNRCGPLSQMVHRGLGWGPGGMQNTIQPGALLKAASLCGLSLPLPLGLGLLSGRALSLPMGLWLWLMLSEELALGLACRHALHSHGYLDEMQAKQKQVTRQCTISHGMPSTRLPPIPLHLTQ